MEISPVIMQVLLGALVFWTIVFGVWVSKGMTEMRLLIVSNMSRAEHLDICTKKDDELNRRWDKFEDYFKEQFALVSKTLEKQDSTSTEFRHKLNNTLQIVQTSVAILKDKADAATAREAAGALTPRRR